MGSPGRVLTLLRAHRGLLLLASVAGPIGFRIALLLELTSGVAPGDLRGFTSDLLVSLPVALLLFAAARLSRVLAVVSAAAWTLLNYGNYETVRALGAVAQLYDVTYLADPTFVLGSALAVSRPLLLATILGLTVVAAYRGAAREVEATPWAPFGAAAFAALAGVWMWPLSDTIAEWRQVHFVPYNIAHYRDLTPGTDAARLARFRDPPSAMLDLLPALRADVSGTPRTPIRDATRPRNVLLIVIESLSGAHIHSIAARHGYQPPNRLGALDRLARENFSATTFIAHNRKTNRGEYTLLCGELPNLLAGEPKMSEHIEHGWQRCLPRVLRDVGYATAYLQAAPLPFMLKDQFMPVAGFERVLGDADLETVRWRTHWGVDDRSLYENARELIAELERGDRPWFLTILTAGTHHPYTVPDEFEALREEPAARALAYADLAIGEFVSGLERDGVLEKALVLITSDESMGLTADADIPPITSALAQNWGVLIALIPGSGPVVVDEPYGQMDIAVSVLDYLGLSEHGEHFHGRSVFRRYDTGRWVFFANTNQLTIGALDPFRRLIVCRAGETLCRKYKSPRAQIFGSRLQKINVDPDDTIVHEMALRSVRAPGRARERRTVQLVAEPSAMLAAGARKVLFGGQYLDLRPDEWLEFDLEIEARGPSGTVRIVHYTKQTRSWAADRPPGPGRMLVEREIALPAGETLQLRYLIAPVGAMQGIQSRATATNQGAHPIELVLRRATMTKRFAGERPTQEVTIERERISPTRR